MSFDTLMASLAEHHAGHVQQIAALEAEVKRLSTPPTLFGFWAGNVGVTGVRASFDAVSAYAGPPDVYRMFYPGSPGTSFVGSNADFGPPVVVSFKFRPQEVVTGQHDATLRAWFASIPADRHVWWSYFHEPENDIEAGAFSAALYREAWTHLLQLAPMRPTLHPTLILMRYTLSIPTRRQPEWYIVPGLEVLCWDSYLTGNLTVDDVIHKPKAASDSFGLGFAVGETSTNQPAKMVAFIRDLKTAAQQVDAKFVCWFETNKKGQGVNEYDWRMGPVLGAVEAWRA